MARRLVPKKKDVPCCNEKKTFTLLSMIAVVIIASSAFSWIGFMNIKHNGGKLPWEQKKGRNVLFLVVDIIKYCCKDEVYDRQ